MDLGQVDLELVVAVRARHDPDGAAVGVDPIVQPVQVVEIRRVQLLDHRRRDLGHVLEYQRVKNRLMREEFAELTTVSGRKVLINPASVARIEEPPEPRPVDEAAARLAG